MDRDAKGIAKDCRATKEMDGIVQTRYRDASGGVRMKTGDQELLAALL
jgi:hypothetical protein